MPAVAIFADGTVAFKDVELTNVVVSAVPFQVITEVFKKLVPVAVIVNEALPAKTVLGVIELSVGAGTG